MSDIVVRAASDADRDSTWRILEPIIRAGETYALPRDFTRDDALAYWFGPSHQVFVAERASHIAGTYYLRPNQMGGGAHIANCGYMTAPNSAGRGIASAMCAHSLEFARRAGFLAVQFNFVLASNVNAVRLWRRFGFEIVGTIPQAFGHPALGLVDALVMHRAL